MAQQSLRSKVMTSNPIVEPLFLNLVRLDVRAIERKFALLL